MIIRRQHFLVLSVAGLLASMELCANNSDILQPKSSRMPMFKQVLPLDTGLDLENAQKGEISPEKLPKGIPGAVEPVADNAQAFVEMEKTIRDQLEDLKQLDFSKAYYAYTASDFQKAFSVDVFKAFVRRNSTLYHNDLFTVDSTAFEGVIGIIKGKLASTDGKMALIEFDFIQEDGRWKIRKIDIAPIAMPVSNQRQK